ncbi:IclR family transcriptional regulator [Rummeliibacillus sp. JY-2-4R]
MASLATGLSIIELVANSESPMKFTEIQDATGITKSNLYKYLNTLIQANMLYRDPKLGDYSLGYALLEYGSKLMHHDEVLQRMSYHLKEISTESNMTTLLASWVNDRPIITQIVNTNFGLNIGAHIGTVLPLLSSVGKVFAAFSADDIVQEWKQESIAKSQIATFENELVKIRNQKFAYSKEPLVRHVSSISFPILNYQNQIIAAIAIVGFTEDIPSSKEADLIQNIMPIILEMSAVFGYKKSEENSPL